MSSSFNACNSIIHHNASCIKESKWDTPTPQQLSLYRKLSDIIYNTENTFVCVNREEDLAIDDALEIIRDASSLIRKHMADYVAFLFEEKEKLQFQLSDTFVAKQNISEHQFNKISEALRLKTEEIEIMINCEYVWSIAEIFWIDSALSDNSIYVTLKFLNVMDKFRGPYEQTLNNTMFDSDNYWKLLYKLTIFGKLDILKHEISNFSSDKISNYSKKAMIDLCASCPIFNCLHFENEDDDAMILPTKNDILRWKNEVRAVSKSITEKQRLMPILLIFLGDTDEISKYCDDWLEWIVGYLYFNKAWIDHKNEMRQLLTNKTGFFRTEKGSIEWMFGCIMSKEYESILFYVNKIFPSWFAVHLCYFLRRYQTDNSLCIEWPRQHAMNGMNFNEYILSMPKMTIIEWIFEYYVEDLMFVGTESWVWLKNYLHFFKRRGLSMLSHIFENVEIKNDKMAFFMLQTCNEFNLSKDVYNSICLRMAAKSYANNMQYGRLTFWCCKCRQTELSKNAFDRYLKLLICAYLNDPSLHINTLHDVCDNANVDQLKNCKLFCLLSKLRNMYLCRYDLQKLDAQYNEECAILNATKIQKQNSKILASKQRTPFSRSRGHLIAALSKPQNAKNKNLKNMADSFDVIIEYPVLKKTATKKKKMEETASRDFILKNLITPPRPTPMRNRQSSHRKSFHKKSLKKSIEKLEFAMDEDDENESVDLCDDDDDGKKEEEAEDGDGEEQSENEKKYMFECCDIIISYVSCLIDILQLELYETAHFIKIIMFSLPMLSHRYSPNAVSLNDVLLITHKWLKIKFLKDRKKSEIDKFDKNHELMHLQTILSHLQSKVLTTTYSNKNYAAIWKSQEQQGMDAMDSSEDDDIVDID